MSAQGTATMDTADTFAEQFVRDEALSLAPRKIPELTVVNTASTYGRNRANPLKHLAHLLHKKLEAAQGEPCNLLQVATEIHSQAKDKRNTTLRRIYDVVNVCEGAGVVGRTVQRGPQSPKPQAVRKARAKRSSVQEPDELQSQPSDIQLTEKRSPRGGTDIRWLGCPCYESLHGANYACAPDSKHKDLVQRERAETEGRLLHKRKILDTISKQVMLLENLSDQNQAQARCYQAAFRQSKSANHSLPSSLLSCSTRRPSSNFGNSFISMNTELNPEIAYRPESTPKLACREFLERGPICTIQEERNTNSSDHHLQPCMAHCLHLPFVMVATDPDTNVEIFMDGDPPHEVYLQLDRDYQLIDHIQVVQMLPHMAT